MSELPKGWTEQLCGETFQQVSTTNIKVKNKETLSSGLYPVIDQGASKVAGYINDADKVIKVKSPVCIFGDHTRIIKWIDFDFVPGADGTKILAPNSYLNERFFYHQLRSLEILDRGYSRHFKYLKESSFKVAPLNEQIRIVDKLDSMLTKVDAAQARLDKIPNILKRFRQSVLAAATSGELTKEWREAHNILIAHWESTVFSDLSREITVGFVGKMSDKYKESGIPFLRSQNVRAFRFDSKNLLYIDDEFHNKIYKSRLEKGDLAVVRSGAPGTTCVIPESLGVANCSDLVIVRPNERLLSEYGCIYMNSSIAQKNVSDNKVGVAQQHFNVGSMKIMPINLPSIVEQKEIVRRVESLFTMADTVEKQHLDAKARTNRLTQSILAKAFRGELVPQDQNDESAILLLERIKRQKVDSPKTVKSNRNTKKKTTPKTPAVTTPIDSNQSQSEVLMLLQKSNSELTAQQIMDKLTEQTFEQVDRLFIELKNLLTTHAISKNGTGENCTFKANKQ